MSASSRATISTTSHAQVTSATAAVIVEPVQGVGGAYDLKPEFLQALRARCDQVGALLIFDEVQCGMGRIGEPFAANLYGIQPDMVTTAKALGNGFPCAALLMSPRVAAPSSSMRSEPPSAAVRWPARPSRRSSRRSRSSSCWRACAASRR